MTSFDPLPVFPVLTFVRGLVLGLAVAAPVGPMSLLCMRQTLALGFLPGLVSGLGIASADAVYGAIAAFGLVAVTDLLVGQQPWLRLLGGGVMLYLGWGVMRSRPPAAAATLAAPTGSGLARIYAAMLGLTLLNPATILSFVALFAGLGLGATEEAPGAPLALVLGVFGGSTLWWLLVTGGIAAARTRISPRVQRGINVVAGLALLAFGVAALAATFTAD